MSILGIDIGGTKINFVLLENQRVVKTQKISTPKTKRGLVDVLKNNIPQGVKKIGIGVPGPLNKKGDLILNPPNLKALWNCPLAKIVEKETGIMTRMENDANCFALGEALSGAGKKAGIVFGITLGTGVGGGVVINKKIYRGAFGSAGEVGHATIKFDGLKCGCGNYGCLEAYCSKNIHGNYGKNLGAALANVVNLLDPEIIVIGGGIAKEYDSFIKQAEREMRKRIISPISKKYVKIKKPALKGWGGAVGAALLWSK